MMEIFLFVIIKWGWIWMHDVCVCVCMCVCLCVYVCVFMHVCMHVCVCVCVRGNNCAKFCMRLINEGV